ncbi:L,D-transpeptidase family protein [Streptomyces sp. SPB162]|uniref:L,D-transpeptidase family protein n=1 Tax=Streptomyces sp. SPB162 TaxID=2940560 RepID=UPI002404E28A|nr:L,D-transpeptidase family protein [Streptomyces sp. SPB162]MDF9811352.1 L,D-peptidoglycan transpeptidase YkuD (ErfK/YbiS/YcfS/YnhG family) [Streptomyces sp. SPB162]
MGPTRLGRTRLGRRVISRALRARRTTAAVAIAVSAVAGTLAGSAPAHAGAAPPPRFPVPVSVGQARQVISVQAHGTYATVIAWQKTGSIWIRRYVTTAARVGSHGVTNGATRKQGTYTTPTGTYTLTQGFGVAADPGTRMPYHRVTTADWWVEDPSSRYYNRMRRAAQGGFPLTEAGVHGSEHLADYPVQYRNALVVDFNMSPAVPGRGAGIFLHALGPKAGPTAGCVAIPQNVLTDVLRWIDPAQHPVIGIG